MPTICLYSKYFIMRTNFRLLLCTNLHIQTLVFSSSRVNPLFIPSHASRNICLGFNCLATCELTASLNVMFSAQNDSGRQQSIRNSTSSSSLSLAASYCWDVNGKKVRSRKKVTTSFNFSTCITIFLVCQEGIILIGKWPSTVF